MKFNLFWSIIYLLMQSRLPSVKCHPNGELLGGRRVSAVRLPHPAAESKGPPPCFRNYGTKEVIFMQKAKNLKSSNNIKMICLAGVMAALYVCLDFLAVSVSAPFGNNLKISIIGLPVIIVAVFCGPWWGAATGFIGAFIGQLISYGIGPTTILWVIPAVARGILMGYLFRAFKKSTKPGIIAIETCISSLVVTLLNTGALLLDNMMYGYTTYYAIFVAIPMRLVAGILTALVFSLMLPTILDSLNNHVKL